MLQQKILLISLVVIIAIILLGVNFFMLTQYTHRDDKGWRKKAVYKIIIIISLTLCQAVTLMIPLDVSNISAITPPQESYNLLKLADFWFFLYLLVLIFICIILPYVIFLYQTDDQKSIGSRMLTAFFYLFLTLIITSMIIFIPYNFLNKADITYDKIALSYTQTYDEEVVTEPTISQNQIIQIQVSFITYCIALMSFAGWILVVLFGGIGLFSLPFDIINQFRLRPKARKSDQMAKTRNQLAAVLKQLIKQGDQLQNRQQILQNNEEARCFEKFRSKRKIHSGINIFKAKYYAVSQQFQLFNYELKLSNVNPILTIIKLILGIVFLITTILWFLQIILGNIVNQLTGSQVLKYLLDDLFVLLEDVDASFVSTFLFGYLSIYFLWCVQRGNIKFGLQIPFLCRFHPLKEHQTWLNSFMLNVILLLISSVGIAELCIASFPIYTRNTEIYTIFGVQVRYMHFFQRVYGSNFFPIALISWSLITLVYLLVTCNRKPKYMKAIQSIRQRVPDNDFQ